MPLPPAPKEPASRLSATAIAQTNHRRGARRAKPDTASLPTQPGTPAKQSSASAATAMIARPQQKPVTAPAALMRPSPRPAPAPAAPRQGPARTAHAAPEVLKAQGKTAARPRTTAGPARLFVVDTNVLLHDPSALFQFKEHDVYIPMVVLEELDAHKKGMTEVARNGRQTSRFLDALVGSQQGDITHGMRLDTTGFSNATGKLYLQTGALIGTEITQLPEGKADNQILGVVAALSKKHPEREVILVSKDINMRVKARALGLQAEDYENDKTLSDGDLLYTGVAQLPEDFWNEQTEDLSSWHDGDATCYRVSGPAAEHLHINEFVYHEAAGAPALYARVTQVQNGTATLKTLRDFRHPKNAVWGIVARNREQNFALNLLMDPEVDLVTLAGMAGTGKTLLALATGLTQVLDERRYTEIIMTRATVSVGEEIGFLPGTEEEKMGPWMGALDDNLEFLSRGDGASGGEWGRAATADLVRSRIRIKSMSFMRGRTFLKKWIVVDEAQNLTPKQMKTLITRAGPGTKIICMGNLGQIDTPYLTEGSSGLTYAVARFRDWQHSGHVTLARGERSRLADYASEVL